jgi:hypothetical protein
VTYEVGNRAYLRVLPLRGVKRFGVKGKLAPRFVGLMRHGVDVISPSSWEPQEGGMMSTAGSFPSVRNQGLSVQEKAKLQKVMLASLVTLQQGRR